MRVRVLFLTCLNDVKLGRKRFHFEAFCPKIDGFLEAVQQAWNSIQPNHCPFLTLDNKFKAAARGLQAWSDKKVGHGESQLTLAREILHQLEIAQDLRLLSHLELELKNNLRKHSLALSSFKRTIARSRSRIQWLKEGMPTLDSSMYRRNTITQLSKRTLCRRYGAENSATSAT
jgi:hypothetical protein